MKIELYQIFDTLYLCFLLNGQCAAVLTGWVFPGATAAPGRRYMVPDSDERNLRNLYEMISARGTLTGQFDIKDAVGKIPVFPKEVDP